MIGYLSGQVYHLEGTRLVLCVEHVGYEIELPKRLMADLQVSMPLNLWIHQIIREDANDLYGFYDLEDRQAFRLLLKAPQVGPKMALAILDVYRAWDLARIGSAGQASDLERVKGLGPKLAERLIVDLKNWTNKGVWPCVASVSPQEVRRAYHEDAFQALIQLGYKEVHVRAVVAEYDGEPDTQALVRHALQVLSKRGQ